MLWFLLHTALAEPVSVAPANGEIRLDGVLSEAAWGAAPTIGEMARYRPSPGEAPPGETLVRFLQDDTYLYIGIEVKGTGYPVQARLSPREWINDDDQVGIYLDTFEDGRSGYIFYVNPLGIQQDSRYNPQDWRPVWSTAWRSVGHVDPDGEGYTIEIAMPWRSLKYQPTQTQSWGLIVTRKIPSLGEKYRWPNIPPRHPRPFSLASTLEGVEPSLRGTGMEVTPSVTGVGRWTREDGDWVTPNVGETPLDVIRPSVDLRYGLGPDLGFTAAVLPDFSQVEADVSDVRVNPRFAFRFPETRPLFLDGSEYFEDPQETLYTRSIQDPLFGLKLAGREGPWAIGVLNALDRAPLATFNENDTPGFNEEDVEGRQAMTTTARVRLDAFKTGQLGMTIADKRVGNDLSGVTGRHHSVGTDIVVPIGERWFTGGSVTQTWTGPAQDELLWGQSAALFVKREGGQGTGMELAAVDRTPGFRQETGYSTQSGLTSLSSELDHTFFVNKKVQTYVPGLSAMWLNERNGDLYQELITEQRFALQRGHRMRIEGGIVRQRDTLGLDDGTTQTVSVDGWRGEVKYDGRISNRLSLEPAVEFQKGLDYANAVPANTVASDLEAVLRPSPALRVDLRGTYQHHQPNQLDDVNTWLARGRVSWQFTRKLGMRLVEEHSTSSDQDSQLLSSVLLTWLDVPGTSVHLGYTEVGAYASTYEAQERIVFAKASLLLRP